MKTPLQTADYCYSLNEELFNLESMGDVVDAITNSTDEPVGATYWRGEKKGTHSRRLHRRGRLP